MVYLLLVARRTPAVFPLLAAQRPPAVLLAARRILAAPSFARYHATEVSPGPAVQGDSAIEEYIRKSAATVHHPVSTCRMGNDANSVVDSQLRVHGVEGLRVVDASVFPSIIGGNTNATVVMIAEKAADMMLGIPAPAAVEPLGARAPLAM